MSVNTAKARRSMKRKSRTNRPHMERQTRNNKRTRLVRHIKGHSRDNCAIEALAKIN